MLDRGSVNTVSFLQMKSIENSFASPEYKSGGTVFNNSNEHNIEHYFDLWHTSVQDGVWEAEEGEQGLFIMSWQHTDKCTTFITWLNCDKRQVQHVSLDPYILYEEININVQLS